MKTILFFFLLLFAPTVFSQTTEWHTLKTDNNEFSFKMPAGCYSYFYNKDGVTIAKMYSSNHYRLKEMRLLSCFKDGILMSVEIYQTEKPIKVLEVLEKYLNKENGSKMILEQSLVGKEYHKADKFLTEKTRLVAGRNEVYILTAATRGESNATMNEFLESQKFLRSVQTASAADANDKAILISSLNHEEPEITLAYTQNAQTATSSDSKTNAKADNAEIKPMILLSKPHPSYTETARRNSVAGIVRMRLTFGADAKIKKIQIIQSLPDGLVREAVFAALRMKFLPMEKDGVPASNTRLVEYNFDLY